jgi:UDP-glucose 4-epimerase
MSKTSIAIVTGGAGFIGSHMADLLVNNNYEVRVIDNLSGGYLKNLKQHKNNPKFTLEEADICNIDNNHSLFKDSDLLFHFAGKGDIVPSIDDPTDYMSTNIQGTVQMLEGARAANISKFVYAASSSCYGLAETPTSEGHKIEPCYPYALSKYQGEMAALHWQKIYNLPVNSIRIFNAYGERARTTGSYGAVFGVFLKQKLEGKPFTVVGDGSQSRDFLYVSDIARAFLKVAKAKRVGEVYNLGAGKPQSINRLIQLIGGDVVYIPERPGEPARTWADIRKIRTHLNWEPLVSFEEGVQKMVACIDDWKVAPLWDPVSIENATENWFKFLDKEK